MKFRTKKTTLSLSLSAAVLLQACVTNLADRTPADFAENSFKRVDPISGQSEVLGPFVKTMTIKKNAVAGVSQLRSANGYRGKNGVLVKGGAYVDVIMRYATATPNPDEARVYADVSWPGGKEAQVVKYGETVIGCRDSINSVYVPNGYGYFGYPRDRGPYWHGDGYGRYPHRPVTDKPPTTPSPVNPSPTHTPPELYPFYEPREEIRDSGPFEPRIVGAGIATSAGKTRVSSPSTSKRVVSRKRVVKPSAKVRVPSSRSRVSRAPKAPKRTLSRTVRQSFDRELRYYSYDRYYEPSVSQVHVRSKCIREESVRIFVPQERLLAAETSGLVLYLRPQAGREEVVDLPANYVLGYKMAHVTPALHQE